MITRLFSQERQHMEVLHYSGRFPLTIIYLCYITSNQTVLLEFNVNSLVLCLSQFQLGTSPPGNPRGLAQKHCLGGRDLTFESCPGAGNSTRAGILWKFKVKHFVRVLVLSVINKGGGGQKLLNNGNTKLLISSSNYAKHHIMCAQEAICVPRLLAIFLRHPA